MERKKGTDNSGGHASRYWSRAEDGEQSLDMIKIHQNSGINKNTLYEKIKCVLPKTKH